MLRCHQEGGGVNPQKRVLWQVSQVSRAAFPEQAELAIKRLGGQVLWASLKRWDGSGGDRSGDCTLHNYVLFNRKMWFREGQTGMTRLEDRCVQHKYLCLDHSGFFSPLCFFPWHVCHSLSSSEPGWGALMPSALLTSLRSQWHLWRGKAWTCRADNL